MCCLVIYQRSLGISFLLQKNWQSSTKSSFLSSVKIAKWQKKSNQATLSMCILLFLESYAVIQVVCCFIMPFHYVWIFQKLQKTKNILASIKNKKEKGNKIHFMKKNRTEDINTIKLLKYLCNNVLCFNVKNSKPFFSCVWNCSPLCFPAKRILCLAIWN